MSGGAFVVVVVAYAVYLGGTSLVLLSSASAASAVVLVCGLGCTVLAASDLYRIAQPRAGVVFRRIVTALGTLAVLVGPGRDGHQQPARAGDPGCAHDRPAGHAAVLARAHDRL